ncbi:hypothetical protein BDZ94DRAFT_1311681 [Collybia nuda]|uniref:Uncharacterized protein n=1 Tax=Collybia nuda TaxID=64659 RepID=A0A9P5Y2P1_9AGAR|nr:hypothetical protein BDZ94DRAFT_1311681 [Collybia nuda]
MLEQCTSIIDATFSISEGVTDIPSHQGTESISSTVEHITLLPRFTIDWNIFLAPLSLPSLTTFTISTYSRSPAGIGPTFTPAMVSLIDQSGCSLQTFSISYNLEHSPDANLPHPDITDLLQKMPSLEAFISGYVAAPELIRTVHISLVQLESISWKVEPGGLSALLDLLDNNISQKTLNNFPSSIQVVCGNGDEFQSVRKRLIQDYVNYEEAGFNITVRNIEGDDIRFMTSGDNDSDGSDIGSVWASGLGDDVVDHSYCCCVQ